MKVKTLNTFVLLAGIAFWGMTAAIDIPQDIINGFGQGKSELVSKYFIGNVELTLNNKENIYSSTQAEIILKDFFRKNAPQSFTIIHEGGKTESKYAIGKLKTTGGNYRVTILLKQSGNKIYIHQLRIEQDAA
ncbi:MAG: DUF4783 domain-containing protein [Bacteroidales bacterium]|nr:DUF4783 domain-containing protein [Bacteroidales bacterium]